MAHRIQIALPEALEARLRSEAAARGSSIDECALELLAEALVPRVPADLESLRRELKKGMEGPAREIATEEWQKKAAAIVERQARSKAG